jgi:CheY-like chemotaxis protein
MLDRHDHSIGQSAVKGHRSDTSFRRYTSLSPEENIEKGLSQEKPIILSPIARCRTEMTTQKEILVVEDDEIIASLIERILQKKDYRVAGKVQTGEDAIRSAADVEPDLVLMDISLKGSIDGIVAARYINGVFNIPVVFLTGHYDDETIERAKVAEPLGFITKPFNDKDIYSSVEIALYNAAMMRRRFKVKDTYVKQIMSMLDAVILTDMDGRILFLNPYAEQLVNVPYRSAIMHPLNRLFHLIDVRTNEPVSEHVFEMVRESLVVGIENNLAMVTNDSRKRYITLAARPIKDSADDLIAALVVIHVMSPTERRLFSAR